jgi:hypothetical protein
VSQHRGIVLFWHSIYSPFISRFIATVLILFCQRYCST